jgi:chemotaxis protein MotB
VIEKLGEALAPFPNAIRVEGHTDNRPIKTVAFISNWELSAARAGSVVRVLASKGVEPGRLAVIGYGENRPHAPNDTVEGRNSNRRVVVVILSTDTAPSPSGENPGQDGTTPAPAGAAAAPTIAAPGEAATATPGLAPAQQTTSTTAPATAPVGALATPVTGTAGNVTSASANSP